MLYSYDMTYLSICQYINIEDYNSSCKSFDENDKLFLLILLLSSKATIFKTIEV